MRRRILLITALVLLSAGLFCACAEAAKDKAQATLIYFFSPSCNRCSTTRANVMPLIEKHFGDRLGVEYRDITDADNYKMLFALKQEKGADEKSVFPVLYIGNKFIDGRDPANLTYESLASFIAQGMGRAEKKAVFATSADIEKHFRSIAPLAIMAAGFVDGINPCAFTVIVFFMSFLFFQGYRKKSIAAVGLSFIVAVFITYFLLGVGLFGWLHAMRGFSLFTKIVGISIGVASIIFGLLSIYDAFVFVKKGESEDMLLHLPKSIRQKIHSIIGDKYRMKKDAAAKHPGMLALMGSALAVGFVISIFESVCTGQLYVPTIIYVLKTSSYKLKAFAYLFLYNLMFIIPLIAIYGLALAGVSSNSFAGAMKKNMFLIKLFLAAMFIFLGISLVHADNSIAPAGKTKAEIVKDPNFYDYGKAKEGDIIKHTFIFKNSEDVPVTIKEINTSCACTTPTVIGDKRVQPGKEVGIELSFDTKGYPGARKRHLFVHTDSKKNALVIFEMLVDVQ